MQESFQCDRCGYQNYIGQPFCQNCGEQFQYNCPSCGAFVDNRFAACPNCGTSLGWPVQQQTQTSVYQQQRVSESGQNHREGKTRNQLLIVLGGFLCLAIIAGGVIFAIHRLSQGQESIIAKTHTPSTQTTSNSPPSIDSFVFKPSSIIEGESSILSWDVTGATSVSITPTIGTVAADDSQTVKPTRTTIYKLTATNNAGSSEASATITVTPSGLPHIVFFTISSNSISSGGSVTLSWNVAQANSVSITPDIGTVPLSGTKTISPTSTTTYNLIATNSTGDSTESVKVTVSGENVPVISSFTASPDTINAGQSSILQWLIRGATSISLDHGIGNPSSAKGQSVSPTENTTYTLTATNSAGSVTASVTVTVNQAAVPIITDFTANPTTINAGQSSTLQWNITGATSVSINQGIGSVSSTTGTRVVTPSASTIYTITATNSNGSTNSSAMVTVTASSVSLPVITSFIANPSTITAGQSSTLLWNITGATSISIDQGIGTPYSSYGEQVSPYITTTYTLTATNSAGSVTASTTVTVN